MKFTIYNQRTGQVLYSGVCQNPGLLALVGEAMIEGAEHVGGWIEGGAHHPQPDAPSPDHTWDWSAKQWRDLRTLADLKALKNTEINAARLRANRTSFTYGGEQIAVDALSRGDIETTNGVVLLTGAMPTTWLGGWKTVTNTYVPIPDVDTWVQFYLAMNSQGALNFDRSQQLKAQLASATSPEQIAAITWEANA